MKENGSATAEIKVIESDYFRKSRKIARELTGHPDKLFDVLIVTGQWLERLKKDKGRMGRLYKNGMLLVVLVRTYLTGKYKGLNWKRLVLAVAALVYLVTIPDLIPDLVPVLGLLDDAGVVAWGVKMLSKEIDEVVVNEGG